MAKRQQEDSSREQRECKRLPCDDCHTSYKISDDGSGQEMHFANLMDLTPTGSRILIPRQVDPGNTIVLYVSFPSFEATRFDTHEIVASIVWGKKDLKTGKHEIGVRFVYMKKEAKHALKYFCNRLKLHNCAAQVKP